MSASAFMEKTQQRTKHVLQMFCERTFTNFGHVTCRCRGTAFSRGRPPPSRAAACSRTLPLASDAVATHLLVVTEHRHNSASRSLESTVSLARHERVKSEHSAPFGTPEDRLVL